MLRLPAVAGSFYPSNAAELSKQIAKYTETANKSAQKSVRACLVPHAGYVYSGHVVGAVLSGIKIPPTIVILGVRHRPPGSPAAIISSGAWRTPLGEAEIDEALAAILLEECPVLKEDALAHSREHSLEVQIPFLQVLQPLFRFVPIALGSVHFETLLTVGESIGRVLAAATGEVLLLTTSDLNHYEDDATTRRKDRLAIEQLLKMDAKGLYGVCSREEISMCGLGPAVAMLTALHVMQASRVELVRYATSADRSGDPKAVVGYAGMIFS
jgi:AmmeMemoRadiSam system protein B